MATADITWEHPDYKAHVDQMVLVQEVVAGIDTAVSYLVQLSNEADERFDERRVNATLSNMTERIVKTTSGKIMRKPLLFDDVPDRIVEEFNTISGDESLDQFTKNMIEWGLIDGKSYILVDAPINGGNPYYSLIGRGQVTNWKKDENGIFTQVVIRETYKEEDGDYGFQYKEQYREIDAVGNVKIWRQSGGTGSVVGTVGTAGTWYIAEEIMTSYNFCPFFELDIAEIPPLYDIAKENILHMNLSSLRYRATVAYSDPFLAFYGMGVEPTGDADNPPLVIGVNQVMTTDNENARIEWIELDGKNFDIVKEQIADIEADIATRGLKLQTESDTVKTATESREDKSESASRLTDIAIDVEVVLASAYDAYTMIKSNSAPLGQITVNKDFEAAVTDISIGGTLLDAKNAGLISHKLYLESMVDAEILDIENIDEEIDAANEDFIQEEPVVPTMVAEEEVDTTDANA